MGQGVYEYDADQLALELGGIIIDSGFADGSFVKIEPDSMDFTYLLGTDGSVTRSKTKNQVLKVTISLMQSSYINDKLSALRLLDKLAPNGAGTAPFTMRDLNGTTLVAGAHAWIAGIPVIENDRAAKSRDWPIIVADGNVYIGSNPKL